MDNLKSNKIGNYINLHHGNRNKWARNIKNIAPQKQNAIYKTRVQSQNAIALLKYLKRIAPQQLMLRTQVFTKKI
jgi:hypothetical protein